MKGNNNPLEALASLRSQPVDLVFLDIQMPELNGLQLAELLGSSPKVRPQRVCGDTYCNGDGDYFTTLKEAGSGIAGEEFYQGA